MKRKNFRKAHTQHSKKFLYELNSINTKKLVAFRNYDEVWLIGKYKGTSINDTPTSYIEWAINNMDLSENSIAILKSKLR
jgi:hypothetical protein